MITPNPTTITMTEDAFLHTFKLITNHFDNNASWDGCMFETFGDELEFVRMQPTDRIWTIVDADDGIAICSGYHLVNRIGYLIASVAKQPDTDYDIVCEGLTDDWAWEEAFDKFGFNDGDGIIHTHEVARAIANLGYIVTQQQWGMHNTVITAITDTGATQLISPDIKIGYQNPRDYLPEAIVAYLDRSFPNLRQNISERAATQNISQGIPPRIVG